MISKYREIWFVDFEFQSPDGERPIPICMVAREWRSGRLLRLWRDELLALRHSPVALTADVLFVAYYASAELQCFLALGWEMPVATLDLCAEFKKDTSGLDLPGGRSLLGALAYYGLEGVESGEKDLMRQLAMRGGPYTAKEKLNLLDYCQTDVDALAKLMPAMLPTVDLPRALIRGKYMGAVARIEWNGVPIDLDTLRLLRERWHELTDHLITQVDDGFGVFVGRSFNNDLWAEYLVKNSIPWPRLGSGRLDLREDTFKEMCRLFPGIAPIHDLRYSLSKLHMNELAVGRDGRNRCMLSAFASKTGRNQPSPSRFIFGPAVWFRSLIKPSPGNGLAYIDYEQQEFGIGAALSSDQAMMEAYRTGDPYMAFAIQAGAVPPGATKETHEAERNQFKICALAVQYGQGEQGLATKLNQSTAYARRLLQCHRETYPAYWKWSDNIEITALLTGKLESTFGWSVNAVGDANPRSLRNFPLQANGAEMLRLACIFAIERGVKVCAPVHDALLIEAPIDELSDVVRECQQAMRDASAVVLDGFLLRTEAKEIRYPHRYADVRGKKMWKQVMKLLRNKRTNRRCIKHAAAI